MEDENNFNINEISQELENQNDEEKHQYSEESHDYEKNILDVKIIVKDLDAAEILIKAVNNMHLIDNYNMSVSSIIPTKDINSVKESIIGADLILISIDLTSEGKEQFINQYKELKTNYNYVEYLIFSNANGNEFIEPSKVEHEIHNSIIRASLTSILNREDISEIQKELYDLKIDYGKLIKTNEQLNLENANAINYSKELTDNNQSLKEEIQSLENTLDDIKSEYSNFKSKFANIYTKDLLEVFNLKELWQESFDEILTKEDKVIYATNNFKPLNIIVGQGFIVAKTKDEAIDWLKIIRTTLIFLENNENLQNDLNHNMDTKNQNIDNSISDGNENNNDEYDMSNFQNLWD